MTLTPSFGAQVTAGFHDSIEPSIWIFGLRPIPMLRPPKYACTVRALIIFRRSQLRSKHYTQVPLTCNSIRNHNCLTVLPHFLILLRRGGAMSGARIRLVLEAESLAQIAPPYQILPAVPLPSQATSCCSGLDTSNSGFAAVSANRNLPPVRCIPYGPRVSFLSVERRREPNPPLTASCVPPRPY